MISFDGTNIDDVYSGGQQDIFVLSVLGTNPGTFVDIGCKEPVNHSNTALLEKYGWTGIGIDIADYSSMWKELRPNSHFICSDALELNYKNIFEKYNLPNPITYLSLDLDGRGIAFNCLKNVIEAGYEFKILTIEHDAYSGNVNSDMIPQRDLLQSMGYILVRRCDSIEDFWINPKYVNEESYSKFIYSNINGNEKLFWKHCKDINYNFTTLYK